jgi:transcriptional regulator GlxA family with amidase domain
MTANRKRIAVAFHGNLQLLDAAGPIEVFNQADRRLGGHAYEIVCAATQPIVHSSSGMKLLVDQPLPDPRSIHTLLVPGCPGLADLEAVMRDRAYVDWVTAAAAAALRVVSVCSGAYVLASLGLLDGKRATTHWMGLDDLARLFPKVRVDREALFVEDGKVWTSAGVAAGIDLALCIVGRDHGRDLALQVARDLVLHVVRPGGQSQFAGPLSVQKQAGPDLMRLIPWIDTHLDRTIEVADMARAVGMSERTFHRRCLRAFTQTPAQLLSELRLDRARTLLSDPAIAIQTVSARCGFKDPAAFSSAFVRRYGLRPSGYRSAFASRF